MNGRGVPKDYNEALKWYRKAVDKKQAGGMFQLGWMYANGLGVAKDPKQAFDWYRKAADMGHANAMHNLGALYDAGRGTRRDSRLGAQWVFKAIKAGHKFSVTQMTDNSAAYTKQFRDEMQRLLRDAGVYNGKIDGQFGPATKRAVEALAPK
jgi:TPR repeat protein